ncbi:MAG: hypothetical protein O2895_01060 [Chloroflexi bacterium]|nr:hypothetical protein [Chloroflexota bacterium]
MVADAPAARPTAERGAIPSARPRRQREEELLVWPDLVFVEFIAALIFTLTFAALAILINAPLQDRANPANTPNPSKAPWYFLNLQELLIHMHPALAGVIVPTVFLIVLAAVPYFDTSNDEQGRWLTTPRAWPNLIVGMTVGTVLTWLLILYDSAKHVVVYERATLSSDAFDAFPPFLADDPVRAWPDSLNWLQSVRALQTDINWPDDLTRIPLGDRLVRTDLLGLPRGSLEWNFPAWIVEQFIPLQLMIGLPILLSIVAWRVGLAHTKRDHMILLFSGWVGAFLVLTIAGTYFRGAGLELLWPWDVKPAES